MFTSKNKGQGLVPPPPTKYVPMEQPSLNKDNLPSIWSRSQGHDQSRSRCHDK